MLAPSNMARSEINWHFCKIGSRSEWMISDNENNVHYLDRCKKARRMFFCRFKMYLWSNRIMQMTLFTRMQKLLHKYLQYQSADDVVHYCRRDITDFIHWLACKMCMFGLVCAALHTHSFLHTVICHSHSSHAESSTTIGAPSMITKIPTPLSITTELGEFV